MPAEPADAERPSAGPALQLKVRLLEVSPMVWRRLLVPVGASLREGRACGRGEPAGGASLRELHGILQAAMGWEGYHLFQFHLRAVRYGSPELSACPPEVMLASFRLRPGSRFLYEYDLNVSRRHELRVEQRVDVEAGTPCPRCLDGHGACPAGDCGGPAGYLARQHEAVGFAAMSDVDTVAEPLEEVPRTRTTAALDDTDRRWGFEAALERMRERERFLPRPFSRREVNARRRRGEHRVLMHQQL